MTPSQNGSAICEPRAAAVVYFPYNESLPPPHLRLLAPSPSPMTTAAPAAPQFELQPYKSLSNDELQQRIDKVRQQLGPRLLILGHHYQQDEVIALADLSGDSY